MAESRALLDQMIEDNQVALAEAREKLRLHRQSTKEDSNDKERPSNQEGSEIIDSVHKANMAFHMLKSLNTYFQ